MKAMLAAPNFAMTPRIYNKTSVKKKSGQQQQHTHIHIHTQKQIDFINVVVLMYYP